jgi:hypothetical protein
MRVLRVLALALLTVGCSVHIPPATEGERPFGTRADSLFLSPMCLKGGNVHLDARVEKSAASAAGRLRVWLDFLEQDCRKMGVTLLQSRIGDSLAVTQFRCPLEDGEWERFYGTIPGEGSRVLVVKELRLHAVRRPWILRALEGLGLADDSRREYGWLELDCELFDMGQDEGTGPRHLVSREADTPWVYNHTDRAGRLMMRGARDAGRLLLSGQSAPPQDEDGEE